MQYVKTFIRKEFAHVEKVDSKARQLLLSIGLYNVISPILGIFTNAFLWRTSHDFGTVAYYNLFLYFCIPLGFYINGVLLRWFRTSTLYVLSLTCEAVTVSTLIFLGKPTLLSLGIFGIFYGISAGIQWANRNALTFKTTRSDNRMYFSSLESNIGTITDILIPIFIGWFLTAGVASNLYTPITAYKILSVLTLIIIIVIGFVMRKIIVPLDPLKKLTLTAASKTWKQFRLFEFIIGLVGGLDAFLPVLMVLSLVGKENTLGVVQSATTILAGIVVYILGKILQIRHRVLLLEISFLFGIVGAGLFSLFYSSVGVFIFFMCHAVAAPFIWIATSSLNYDLIDEAKKEEQYAYVCDQELYLNGGRFIAILCFFLLITYVSGTFALRFAPLFLTGTQLLLLFVTRNMERKNPNRVTQLGSTISER